MPTGAPTHLPTTSGPTSAPTIAPSESPTWSPTAFPTALPTALPTLSPALAPTDSCLRHTCSYACVTAPRVCTLPQTASSARQWIQSNPGLGLQLGAGFESEFHIARGLFAVSSSYGLYLPGKAYFGTTRSFEQAQAPLLAPFYRPDCSSNRTIGCGWTGSRTKLCIRADASRVTIYGRVTPTDDETRMAFDEGVHGACTQPPNDMTGVNFAGGAGIADNGGLLSYQAQADAIEAARVASSGGGEEEGSSSMLISVIVVGVILIVVIIGGAMYFVKSSDNAGGWQSNNFVGGGGNLTLAFENPQYDVSSIPPPITPTPDPTRPQPFVVG